MNEICIHSIKFLAWADDLVEIFFSKEVIPLTLHHVRSWVINTKKENETNPCRDHSKARESGVYLEGAVACFHSVSPMPVDPIPCGGLKHRDPLLVPSPADPLQLGAVESGCAGLHSTGHIFATTPSTAVVLFSWEGSSCGEQLYGVPGSAKDGNCGRQFPLPAPVPG